MRAPALALALPTGAFVVTGCFTGDATIGAVCTGDADCGDGQQCRHEICGRCGDGIGQRGEVCFSQAQARAETAAGRLALADVDGDGRADVVAWTPGAAAVTVHLRGGDGSLSPQPTIDFGVDPIAVAVGDLDGDGALDLAAAGPSDVFVAWGDGTGTFAPAAVAAVTSRPVALVVAASPARIVVATEVGELAWWEVAVDRSVTGPTTVDAGDAPVLAAAATIDSDASVDLLVGTADGALTLWRGDGRDFVRGPSVDAGVVAAGLDLLDVDGDGRQDVAVLDAGGEVALLRGDGEGGFVPSEILDVPGAPRRVVARDVNRDALRDVLVVVDADPTLSLFVARGRLYPDRTPIAVGSAVADLVVDDLDGDQRLDLLVATDAGLSSLEAQP